MKTLQLTGGTRERWLQYREYVIYTLPFVELNMSFSPEEFACESAAISGEQADTIPWPAKVARLKKEWEEAEILDIEETLAWAQKTGNRALAIEAEQRRRDMKYPTPQWVEDFKLNDLAVAASCLSSRGRQREIMHPMIANMSLCRHKLAPKWRNASYIGSNTGFPAAKHVQRLTELWMKSVLAGARQLQNAPDNDRRIYSWALHDALLSIQPFKDGNERTARVMFQLVRRELELPKVFFPSSAMVFHTSRVRAFRSGIFIPLMKSYGFLN